MALKAWEKENRFWFEMNLRSSNKDEVKELCDWLRTNLRWGYNVDTEWVHPTVYISNEETHVFKFKLRWSDSVRREGFNPYRKRRTENARHY